MPLRPATAQTRMAAKTVLVPICPKAAAFQSASTPLRPSRSSKLLKEGFMDAPGIRPDQGSANPVIDLRFSSFLSGNLLHTSVAQSRVLSSSKTVWLTCPDLISISSHDRTICQFCQDLFHKVKRTHPPLIHDDFPPERKGKFRSSAVLSDAVPIIKPRIWLSGCQAPFLPGQPSRESFRWSFSGYFTPSFGRIYKKIHSLPSVFVRERKNEKQTLFPLCIIKLAFFQSTFKTFGFLS